MTLKKHFKTFLVTGVSLYLTALTVPGFLIVPRLADIALAALVLKLLNSLIRPFLKLLLLPLHIVTLGLLRWLTNVIIIYLLVVLVNSVNLTGFELTDIPLVGGFLPGLRISRPAAAIFTAAVYSGYQTLLLWLLA